MWRQTCVAKLIFIDENTAFLYNYDKSGDNKALFATIVANVATKRIWFDTAVLGGVETVSHRLIYILKHCL